MPEQQSSRGDAVTKATFTGAFDQQIIRLGLKGLNLQAELTAVPPEQLTRMTNAVVLRDGEITGRPGQTTLATAGTEHHSVRALRDPQTGTDTRVWGVDSALYIGASGALTQIDSGYSGSPLTLVPHRPPLSGDPWMFVADRSRMRKVRADGLDLPIGLPAPMVAAAGALGVQYRLDIALCDPVDGTDAAQWVGHAGTDVEGNYAGVPLISDGTPDTGEPGASIYFRTTIGAITDTYDSWIGLAKTADLTQMPPVGGGGTISASDDDFIHFWTVLSLPHLIEEIRLYFVCSPVFEPSILPGAGDGTIPGNEDAYVKGFRRDDFTQFILGNESQIDAAETARVNALRDDDLADRAITDTRSTWEAIRASRDPARRRSLEAASGSYQWVEFGRIGIPLRRGDFQRIGVKADRDWSTITGIILYVRTAIDEVDSVVVVGFDDLYITGGWGPDTAEPGAQPYDVRYTHYDPRTGAESNGAPEMVTTAALDSLRRAITWTPTAYGDGAVRQRFYRRGGTIIDNWYFLGENASDGGIFTDHLSDDAITAAGTLAIDHYQPVPTVDDAGNTVLAQPLPALWGPLEGMLLGCGDPYRPGHLYFSNANSPDHWASDGNVEVCPPSEELMGGGLIGHQGFVFSTQRLYLIYPNLTGSVGVTVVPTQCKRGIRSRWAFCTGPGGIYFVAEGEGVFVTQGGEEEEISRDIRPIFRGETAHAYLPVDWLAKSAIRLSTWQNSLYLLYQDTDGARQVLVYDFLEQRWRHYHFGRALSTVQGEEETTLLLGALNGGKTYTHHGTSDDTLPIAAICRTGAFDGGVREEKLFGDQILDCDRQGVDLVLQNFLNEETVDNLAQAVAEGAGRQRYILDGFGEVPQRARSISTEIRWSSAHDLPILYRLGYAVTEQPEITQRRVTNWDDLNHPDEKWVSGITFDVDTGNVARTIIIERDFAGLRTTVATLTVQTNGRHKVAFSWPAVPAHMVRVRPTDECQFWILYRTDWIALPEPPRIAGWDVHFENAWDQYYTGLDLYCDTSGIEKQIEVSVDGVVLTNPFTGLAYFPVLANGRKVVHLTFTAGRGHVFRFRAIDLNPGLLYTHRWHLQEEPSEQANWNQNFTTYGSHADKWLKAIIFECDTFGQTKNVRVEVDGTLVETLAIQADGRRVVQVALAEQALGRVWRMYPADGNPGRLYSAQPVFDEEPFKLDRWETQETNHGLPTWFSPLYANVTLKTTAPVTFTVQMQTSQRGALVSYSYTIPSTLGKKQRRFVPFRAVRGVLVKYLLTSDEAFWLYREETTVLIQPWGASQPIPVSPFGNSGQDQTRSMVNAIAAAQTSGGGTV